MTDMINSPNILYLGFNPSVFFNTSFLKSSINPIIPNPIVKINIGNNLFANSF